MIDRSSVPSSQELAPTARAVQRFWSNVVRGPGNECWIWVGPISTPDGYGRFTWQTKSVRRTLSAHRFALLLELGEDVPAGYIGEHACCEPLCVRVHEHHLRVATQAENIDYAVFRGRHVGNQRGAGSELRAERSMRVRSAVINGWDKEALHSARAGIVHDPEQIPLW
ncbi:hypothetical protein EKI59_11145 [Corynebacterium sanguinis]|uniref:HNH nuclease domain-containing protein n=1 Tax=Corynebacterium sanguinis TaxID=2594913 RepID=A0A6C1TY54_9CORY|nr:hypothetical protein EKI59_11145 [Corynebacterium sanguinis]